MTAGLGWIGAAIALATTVASGIISARQAKKQNAANKQAAQDATELQSKQNEASLIEYEKMKLLLEMQQQQQAAELAAQKENERKIIKYGSIIAAGFLLYDIMKNEY